MEDLSMFQRPRTVALEDEKPGTYGTVLIYPLNRLVECGFMGNTAVNPWVGIFCRRQAFAKESDSLMSSNPQDLNSIHELGQLESKWRFFSMPILLFVYGVSNEEGPVQWRRFPLVRGVVCLGWFLVVRVL
ncbi:hypothetical protein PIB30_022275 [Stylosanthes scabra]|uniref:Uncharacterized protein n=1 Tax=Stylosanthes scabra TaxID=79078 RepID=A0ABU6S9F7_9FABA|nr:hypothetical protein [Stylosanthes scabra]